MDTVAQRLHDPEDWGRDPRRQPVINEDETLEFSEPGRILRYPSGNGVDCRSHSFAVSTTNSGRFVFLYVRHGGGDERHRMDTGGRILDALRPLDSDARYWLLHRWLDAIHEAQRATRQDTASEYAQAFAEGRLKKRRRNNRIYVEIQPRVVHAA